MNEKKARKIPTISADRIDKTPANVAIGMSKEERKAHAFVKGKEPIQPFTIRMPISLYKEIRELAFKNENKINHIVLKLLRDYIKHSKNY